MWKQWDGSIGDSRGGTRLGGGEAGRGLGKDLPRTDAVPVPDQTQKKEHLTLVIFGFHNSLMDEPLQNKPRKDLKTGYLYPTR